MNIVYKYKSDKKPQVLVILLLAFTGPSMAQLNDTGQIACANEVTVQLLCNDILAGTDVFPGQDAQQGLDATLFNPDDGMGGFSFTKLDAAGVALTNQQDDYATTPWSCVEDHITGLMWEIKTDDEGLQDRDWTYSWFNSMGINDGGGAGVENSGLCVDLVNCDTEKFTSAINSENLCGHADWRLPDPLELLSIVVFNPIPFAEQTFPLPPAVDVNYFPHTLRTDYWTAYTTAVNPAAVQVVYFGGNTSSEPKSFPHAMRLVRGQIGESP